MNMTAISVFTHFTILKWRRRHLVNRFPLDNATLKLQHHGVGRRLAHRKHKRCVCGTRRQGQQSVWVMRKFLEKGLYCIRERSRCGHYKWTMQQDSVPSHTARSIIMQLTWKCHSTSWTWRC